MSLKLELREQMKKSMKSGDKIRLGVIRFVMSNIKNVEIDQGELDDEGVLKVIRRELKQTREAIEQFEQAGRTDLVESEKAKVKILSEFVPASMPEAEVAQLVDQAIEEHGQNMGQIMGAVRQASSGRAEGAVVARLVKQRLATYDKK